MGHGTEAGGESRGSHGAWMEASLLTNTRGTEKCWPVILSVCVGRGLVWVGLLSAYSEESRGRLWELEGGCEVRVRASGFEPQAKVDQENPQADLHFGGETFALAEQEPLFLVTLSGQFREGAWRPQRTRGHKRQCWELWKHI